MFIVFTAYWCCVCWVAATFLSEDEPMADRSIAILSAPITFIIIPMKVLIEFTVRKHKRYRYSR